MRQHKYPPVPVPVPTYVSRARFRTRGHMWVNFVVGFLICSERFFSGFSVFSLFSKTNISKFQFDRMQDLPEKHFRVSRASWVNIIHLICKHAYYPILHENRRSWQLNGNLSSFEESLGKKSRLVRDSNPGPRDCAALLYQLSYQSQLETGHF